MRTICTKVNFWCTVVSLFMENTSTKKQKNRFKWIIRNVRKCHVLTTLHQKTEFSLIPWKNNKTGLLPVMQRRMVLRLPHRGGANRYCTEVPRQDGTALPCWGKVLPTGGCITADTPPTSAVTLGSLLGRVLSLGTAHCLIQLSLPPSKYHPWKQNHSKMQHPDFLQTLFFCDQS